MLNAEGLTGQYFHNPDFTGLAFERIEAVNHAWGAAAPGPGVQPDSFSVRWLGQVDAKFSETYTFRTISDDGVRLWVDGQLLIDNWTVHSAVVNEGNIALEAGRRYDVRLEYFENADSSQIRLQWVSPSQPLEAIPAASLYASPAGLLGEYSDSTGARASRIDAAIDFDWGSERPISGVAADDFRVRWSGLLRPEFSDEYVFSTLSDEGVQLWVGDELVIDHWAPHSAATAAGAKTLEAGKWYDVRLEYFDDTGPAEIALSWSSERQTGAGHFETIPAENLRAARSAPLLFSNPLGPGQDPFVIRWENAYLHIRSAGRAVWIDSASELQHIHPAHPQSTSIRAWTAPTGTSYSEQIWAPELHQIDGKWYIYVAASDGRNQTHRMYVLERDDPDPLGPYVFKGQIAASVNRWAIDGTVLQWQGKLYFIWSGWPGFVDGQQNLYIAEMSNPWTIEGDRVLLSSPQYAWEKHGLPINEGPQILVHDGKLHVIYSASGYWTDQYALGRLSFDGVGPIMSPSSWTKAPTPVFQASNDVVGVGHASFTKSPDATEHWIVYHAHHDPGPFREDRDIRIQRFSFDSDGTPNFGTPLSNAIRQEIPSGAPDADLPFMPGDFDANGAVGSSDLGVWAAQWGQEVFPGFVRDGSDFLAWQRNLGAAIVSSTAPIEASLDEASKLLPGRSDSEPHETRRPLAHRPAIREQLIASGGASTRAIRANQK